MKNKKICLKCEMEIDLDKERYVLLGTYEKGKTVNEAYFHIVCWKLHFEEKARQKAEAVVKGMQQKIMPMAKGILEKFAR